VLAFGAHAASLGVGIRYINDVQCEKALGAWIFVWAAVWLTFYTIIQVLPDYESVDPEQHPHMLSIFITSCCVKIFLVFWLIFGTVWTFLIDPLTHRCPQFLYKYCVYFLIFYWILFGFRDLILLPILIKCDPDFFDLDTGDNKAAGKSMESVEGEADEARDHENTALIAGDADNAGSFLSVAPRSRFGFVAQAYAKHE
jgi:hypothetical protein